MNNEPVLGRFSDYAEQTLKSDLFMAAYLVDARYRGEKLKPAQVARASEFLISLHPESESLKLALTDYLADSAPYNTRTLSRAGPSWWQAGLKLGFNQELASIALDLSACTCNSAGLERNFSTLANIYGDKRANLEVDKAGMLSFLNRYYNRKD